MKKLEKKVSVFKSMAAEWKWLLKYILNYKKEVFLYIVVGVFGIAMGLGSSVASKYLIDAVVSPSKDLNEIITSCLEIVIFYGSVFVLPVLFGLGAILTGIMAFKNRNVKEILDLRFLIILVGILSPLGLVLLSENF